MVSNQGRANFARAIMKRVAIASVFINAKGVINHGERAYAGRFTVSHATVDNERSIN